MADMDTAPAIYIHPTADVSPKAVLGEGVRIWHQAQVREGAVLGRNCIVGKGVYIDFDVRIGDNVKIQNRASVYHGVTLENGVFVGPHVIFTNDKLPRAVNPDGSLKRDDDWELGEILVREGASIGAGAIIVTGVVIGRWAMIGAGAVVTKDVPDYGLVYGNPARLHGYACPCGHKLELEGDTLGVCPVCGRESVTRGRQTTDDGRRTTDDGRRTTVRIETPRSPRSPRDGK